MKSRRYSLFLPRDLANGLMRAYWDKSHFLYSVIDRGNITVMYLKCPSDRSYRRY
ncbi:uncharacterized protein An01g04190 [Aspergillus niger]|uniref:Contig An01c0140, genomic contig n=2 Tax=Aspergillus niger TaxID=5061 RepID=A2Q8F8_ASPNC|nr:uncharacterized protein An01g04190 [Aspergillus niger]CAK36955.1 unnamed protein product [Aspergillus niger]